MRFFPLGSRVYRGSQFTWAPTLTSHDPNPPITLETGGGAAAFELNLEALSYSISLADATLVAGRVINAEPLSYSITLVDTTLVRGFNFSADPLSYAVALFDTTLLATRQLSLDPLVYTITLAPATLSTPNISFNAESLTFTVTLASTKILLDLDDFPPSVEGGPAPVIVND